MKIRIDNPGDIWKDFDRLSKGRKTIIITTPGKEDLIGEVTDPFRDGQGVLVFYSGRKEVENQ